MSTRIERARLLIGQSRFELAEKELGLALADDPDSSTAHSLMALCLLAREKFDAAEEHARRGVACGPTSSFAFYVMANVWKARNELDEAETAIKTALDLDPDRPAFHTCLGEIRLRRSDWPGAQAAAETALGLDPQYVDAVNLKAMALRRQGDKRLAGQQLIEALRIDPDDAQTHANLGWNYLEAGQRAKAMEHFREALRLDPELEWARIGVLQTLKSHNVIYRGLLKYFFWLSNFGQRGQWMIVVGAWFGYMFLRSVAKSNPAMAPFIVPLIVAYLVFALATWMAEPLANLALRLHPFGRLALSRDERVGANWVGGILAATLVAGIASLASGSWWTQDLLLFFALMILPIGATVRCETPWPRRPMIVYSAIVAFLGLVQLALLTLARTSDPDAWSNAAQGAWLMVMQPLQWAFPLGAVLSLWMANIVQSVQWRR